MREVLETGKKGAIKLSGINEITYVSKTGRDFSIQTTGYENMMLWSNDKSMFCIEPVNKLVKENNNIITPGTYDFLKPGETKKFEVDIIVR